MPPTTTPSVQNGLDAIFDGIDINLPTASSTMSDPALEAGDFMDQEQAPTGGELSTQEDPTSDWAASSALGADLLAAFNASGGDEPPLVTPESDREMSFGEVAVPLTQRLSALAGNLRAEGRLEDADLVTEAMATINLG